MNGLNVEVYLSSNHDEQVQTKGVVIDVTLDSKDEYVMLIITEQGSLIQASHKRCKPYIPTN